MNAVVNHAFNPADALPFFIDDIASDQIDPVIFVLLGFRKILAVKGDCTAKRRRILRGIDTLNFCNDTGAVQFRFFKFHGSDFAVRKDMLPVFGT